MTKIIGPDYSTPSISNSLGSIADSTFGYGALGFSKYQSGVRKKAQAATAAKAQAALRSGDALGFLTQSMLAGTSGDDALNYARAAGLLPARPSVLDPVPRNPAAAPATTGAPYNAAANVSAAPGANRPARPLSVWDKAPGSFSLTPGGSTKIPQNPFDGPLAPLGYNYGQF